MNDLQKELQALKEKVAELESRIVETKKWQPKDGGMYEGMALETDRPTQAQAKRAAVEMRRFNRLLALRDELCGDEVIDWSNNATGFYLYFSYYQNRWGWSSDERCESIQPYFTSEETAQKACAMLNSGEVEL